MLLAVSRRASSGTYRSGSMKRGTLWCSHFAVSFSQFSEQTFSRVNFELDIEVGTLKSF